eukprot:8631104-Karenia_brevis.AAC.1
MVKQAMFTDIVNGPWKDSRNGPLAALLDRDYMGGTDVTVLEEAVSVWRLGAAMSFDADLVGAFGLWANVLTDEICERCGSPENHPTERNR